MRLGRIVGEEGADRITQSLVILHNGRRRIFDRLKRRTTIFVVPRQYQRSESQKGHDEDSPKMFRRHGLSHYSDL